MGMMALKLSELSSKPSSKLNGQRSLMLKHTTGTITLQRPMHFRSLSGIILKPWLMILRPTPCTLPSGSTIASRTLSMSLSFSFTDTTDTLEPTHTLRRDTLLVAMVAHVSETTMPISMVADSEAMVATETTVVTAMAEATATAATVDMAAPVSTMDTAFSLTE